jgi:putative membrane protein
MIAEEDLPTVNAALNGSCAVLLFCGFTAIRSRRIALHKTCMIAALFISIVFLGSYLYYHIQVKAGKPTEFTGQGWIRGIYFTVLISHTILAALVAPMAVFTAYQGIRGRLSRHVKVARWTLPVWLYVSITGVLVYWMLYHLYPEK